MSSQLLEISTKIQVQKPVTEVFEAIVDPEKMSNYFISRGSGRMEAGREISWSWNEVAGEYPVQVQKIEPNKYISFHWEAAGRQTLVEMNLDAQEDGSTLVTITEKSMENNENGLKWLKENTGGWMNFLDCLKAYLEYGINLRKGAFLYMKK
jgi:uncharacterized protein YndB with AHSA1/START domain